MFFVPCILSSYFHEWFIKRERSWLRCDGWKMVWRRMNVKNNKNSRHVDISVSNSFVKGNSFVNSEFFCFCSVKSILIFHPCVCRPLPVIFLFSALLTENYVPYCIYMLKAEQISFLFYQLVCFTHLVVKFLFYEQTTWHMSTRSCMLVHRRKKKVECFEQIRNK